MRSITDEKIPIYRNDTEFLEKWDKWMRSDLSKAYRVLLGDRYDVMDVFNLPIPEWSRDAKLEEQRAQLLEQSLLTQEIRENEEEFNQKIEDNNFSITQIYQAFILEVCRLWRHLSFKFGMIRNIWYAGFKMFGQFLRGSDFTDSDGGLLIRACSNWMSSGLMNYYDIFVQDTTRKMFSNDYEWGWKNVFFVVEKDAASDDLQPLADMLGCKFVISGHGVPSMASIEKALVLRQLKEIKENHPEITNVVLAIVSDYDHAGLNGVAGGFVQQFKTFCKNVGLTLHFKRVGLLPEHVPMHRLKPSFALYTPKQRGVVRCNKCKEQVHICNTCGKVKNTKKIPKYCGNSNLEGETCNGDEFTSFSVNTKVPVQNSRSGFLRKEDRDMVLQKPEMMNDFINQVECKNCHRSDQDLVFEATPWFTVYGVPYCATHDIVHTTKVEEFSDRNKFRIERTCVIERYGIELDALGASYYFDSIVKFLFDEIGIPAMSEFARKQFTPSEEDYQIEAKTKAEDLVRENSYDYKDLSFRLDLLETFRVKLEEKREELIDPIYNEIWENSYPETQEESWDDRQRTWDDDVESWTEDSVLEMFEKHENMVKRCVKQNRSVISWSSGLDFENMQLEEKYRELLDNTDFNISSLDQSEYDEQEEENFDISIIPKESEDLLTILKPIAKNNQVRALLRTLENLTKVLADQPNEEEISEQIPDQDFDVLTKFMQLIVDEEDLLEESDE